MKVSHRIFQVTFSHLIPQTGPEEVSRLFILSVGAWANTPDNEIWFFDRGFWSKSHALWTEVQKADWKDVILKDEFKKTFQKDIYGFFNSEDVYRELLFPGRSATLCRLHISLHLMFEYKARYYHAWSSRYTFSYSILYSSDS